jgi:hypothetical protein
MYYKKLHFFGTNIHAIVVFALVTLPIFSTEIAIAPAILEGELPSKNQNLGRMDLKREFSLLASDIVQSYFIVNTSVTEIQGNGNQSWKEICSNSRFHYALKDQFLFLKDNQYSVYSTLYNCKNGTEIQKESMLQGYIVQSLAIHYQKMFSFLARKPQQNPSEKLQFNPDIRMFLDANGSLTLEKTPILEFINGLRTSGKFSTHLYAVNNSREISSQSGDISSIPFSGKTDPSILLSHFGKFNKIPSSNGDGVIQFILLSPNQTEKEIPWISLINQSRQKNIRTVILVPAHANPLERIKFQKIANATQSELSQIRSSQTIGLIDGEILTLFLDQGYLYYSKGKSKISQEGDGKRIRIDSFEPISSFSMAEIFEKQTRKKIIQKSEPRSNIGESLRETMQRIINPESQRNSKYIVSAYGEGLWLHLNPKSNLTSGQKYLLETEFILDMNSSNGLRNDSKKTKIHRQGIEYPKLLEYKPSEVLNYMKKYKMDRMKCYMQISVGDQD